MSRQAAEHHRKAAEHHEHAARHHGEAAKHYEAGDHQMAAHHAHTAHGISFTLPITRLRQQNPMLKTTVKRQRLLPGS
jgi:hypothetical protein